jgi:tRNA threonylcarbamoyladenosine biosynthesis protein TsaB
MARGIRVQVLGIETSTSVCGVAVVDAGRVVADCSPDMGVHHAARLLPTVARVLEETGLEVADLDGIAVSAGPGSFTGLRIGMGTAKGLCVGSGVPLVSVSTLEALALNAAPAGVTPVCATLDARRGEVYAGVYRFESCGRETLVADDAWPVADLIPKLPRPVVFVGTGIESHRGKILRALEGAARFVEGPLNRPRAASVALLGASMLGEGVRDDVREAEPNYLRRSQAERVRDERLVGSRSPAGRTG